MKIVRTLMMISAAALLASGVGAQDLSAPDPTLSPSAAPAAPAPSDAFGLGTQDYWVVATDFAARTGGSQWSYQGFLYFATPVAAQYEAAVNLPEGAAATALECYWRDTDAANSGTVGLWVHSYDVSTETPSVTNITTNQPAAGAPGTVRASNALAFTFTHRPSANLRNTYTLIATMPASNTVQLRACRIAFNRQVSPAPASATFSDVPTSHPQFRFIEALVAAGVTGGCGAGTYCPDAPLTRGQMAVFLSAALGLHFQY